MTIHCHTRRFITEEEGAITVDWVVLTAGVCSLVAVAMAGLYGNMTSVGQAVGSNVSNQAIVTTF